MTAPARMSECQEDSVNLPGAGARLRILLVDDSRTQRRILASLLVRTNHIVREAASATEAIEICRTEAPDIIISDWMMPAMSGLALCGAVRSLQLESYVYFILLTSRTEKTDVATGLAAGADDFLTKPVNGEEIRARIAAGGRILHIERELKEKNRLVSSTLGELQALYDSINRDLVEARKLQQSLIRERHRSFGSTDVSLLLRPAGHIGGDLVGFFPISARRIAVFAIDVSGHGITSAMITARLAGHLSGVSPEQNIALVLTEFGIYDAHRPSAVASLLNRIVLEEMQTDSYFTLAYADFDMVSGRAVVVQAGHPHPAILRADGTVEHIGNGGFPIGILADAEFDDVEVTLANGDRLVLLSDGFTEASGPEGELLGDEGVGRLLAKRRDLSGEPMLDALLRDVAAYGNDEFADDVSAVLVEFHGPKILDG